MKPYGVPRNNDIQYPDVATILLYGGSSKHGVHMKTRNKASSRRIWKRKARIANKAICKEGLDE